MTEPRIMRMEPNGPAGVGMTEWDTIPPEALTAGTPVQRGFVYHDDAKNGLTAGVWDCTPMTAKPGPYEVNEFMVVLEGAVTIVDQHGGEETIRAGEAFVIPKGMPSTWRQPEYIRKFYVIFDDASGLAPEDPSALRVIRPRPDDGLAEIEVDTSIGFVGDAPTQHAQCYFTDMTGQMTVGQWQSTPFERAPGPFPRHELMHLLEGSVTLTDGDGVEHHFSAGDTLFVPRGAVCGWKSSETVRKFYCIFIEKQAQAQSDAAE